MFNDKIILKSEQRFRNDHHRVCTEEVNKIALSSYDDKRLQTYNRITTYPYGAPATKFYELNIITKWKGEMKVVFNTLEGIRTAKIASSFQYFGGNIYSKNRKIMYIINDKFWWLYYWK